MQSAVVYHVLSMMPVHRQMVDNGRASMSQEQMREFSSGLLSGTLGFRRLAAESAVRLRILAVVDRHAADLARRAGMFDVAGQAIGRAAQIHMQDQDATGAGACYMDWGDWKAAVSSSPVLWNLFAREGTGDGSNLTWILEASEFSLDGANFSEASEAYARAADCFTRDGSRRGLAVLKLREAYFAILKDDWPLAVQLLAVAREAAELSGDRLLAELAGSQA